MWGACLFHSVHVGVNSRDSALFLLPCRSWRSKQVIRFGIASTLISTEPFHWLFCGSKRQQLLGHTSDSRALDPGSQKTLIKAWLVINAHELHLFSSAETSTLPPVCPKDERWTQPAIQPAPSNSPAERGFHAVG